MEAVGETVWSKQVGWGERGCEAVVLLRLASLKTVGVEQNCAGHNPFNFNTGSRCRARSSCALLSLLMEQTLSPSLPSPVSIPTV